MLTGVPAMRTRASESVEWFLNHDAHFQLKDDDRSVRPIQRVQAPEADHLCHYPTPLTHICHIH